MLRSAVIAALSLAAAATVSAQNAPRHNAPLGPYTLYPHFVRCSEVPIPAQTEPTSSTLTIKGGQNTDNHISYVRGDEIVLSAGTNQNIEPGQRYVARRLETPLGPQPKKGEGYIGVRTTGWVTVTAVGADMALARVDFACDALAAGNYLEPYIEPVVPASAGPRNEPNFDDRARILFGDDRRQQMADGEMAYIDRGSAQGVVPGARFAIYRDRHVNGLPLVYVGDGVVTEAGENTSQMVLVLIKDAIYAGDTAVPRKPQ